MTQKFAGEAEEKFKYFLFFCQLKKIFPKFVPKTSKIEKLSLRRSTFPLKIFFSRPWLSFDGKKVLIAWKFNEYIFLKLPGRRLPSTVLSVCAQEFLKSFLKDWRWMILQDKICIHYVNSFLFKSYLLLISIFLLEMISSPRNISYNAKPPIVRNKLPFIKTFNRLKPNS